MGLYRAPCSCLVLQRHVVDGLLDLDHVPVGLLYRGAAVRLSLPSCDIAVQLVELAFLLLDVLAQLAVLGLAYRVIDELEAARLARPVLLVALLSEVAPPPVPAVPACLVEEAHGCRVSFDGDQCGMCGGEGGGCYGGNTGPQVKRRAECLKGASEGRPSSSEKVIDSPGGYDDTQSTGAVGEMFETEYTLSASCSLTQCNPSLLLRDIRRWRLDWLSNSGSWWSSRTMMR